MHIDEAVCVGCGACIPYCPMGAIALNEWGAAQIDHEECVECGVCLRSAGCPGDAIVETLHPWPRSVRAAFSNPLSEHKETRIPGRGTEEMKTNDVTGRFRRGHVGVAIELGRPGIGAHLREVQKVARAVAECGARFEPQNPVTCLMTNKETGDMNPEVLNEKVLSAIVEFTVAKDELPAILNCLREVAQGVETVFSVDLICRVEPDGMAPTVLLMRDMGIAVSVNGKTNCGMGRPLAVEVTP